MRKIMENTKQALEQAVASILEVTDYFYKQHITDGYQHFQDTLNMISAAIEELFNYKAQHEAFNFDEDRLVNTLKEALNAMEQKDLILMADILQYDLLEQFQELESAVL